MTKLVVIQRLVSIVATTTIGVTITNTNIAQAAIVNGGFETGDFTGWNTLGATSIEDASFGTGPVEGTFQGLATSGVGSVSDTAIESALGLSSGTLDSISTGNATEGSVIYQTFTIDSAAILELDFNFLTNEFTPDSTFNDFGFISLVSTNSVADTNSLFTISPTTFFEETGFQTFSQNLAAGTYTLGIGALDVTDTVVDSGILVDNVVIKSVPEPTSILGLLIVGYLGLGIKQKKK